MHKTTMLLRKQVKLGDITKIKLMPKIGVLPTLDEDIQGMAPILVVEQAVWREEVVLPSYPLLTIEPGQQVDCQVA
jgi:hypothetical protein